MKCPKCQFENREGASFCLECGMKMTLKCPQCGKAFPILAKFCDECGQRLSELGERETQLQEVEAERKHVTVLFSDLVGYTAMTERLDAEDVKEIMSRIFGEIAQVVTKYEGFIERFFGDEVMALFGVPKAHEDDPMRAIRAAREIHRVVEDMSPKYETEIGHPLSMHTGINTGLLVTGDEYIGKGRHGLTGDAVNLASRLAKLAQAGETLVGQDTYRHAEGYFIFEHLGLKRIRGKEEPVNAYQVIAPSTRRTRFEVSAERGLTPLVGRKRELQQLKEGFKRCKAGRGEAFSIVSEAGLGKSRLLYEFRKVVAKEKLTFLEGKCLSYSKGAAYQPVIDILKSNFDIMEGEGDAEIREKVKKGLIALGAEETSTLPCLLELLSVKDSGLDRFSMSPEGKKERIMEALKRIVLKGSEIRPLIMAIEDLHWIDKSSEDVFKELLDSLSGARIFLIFTYRPEYAPSWGVKSYHRQINLNRLSEGESFSMVTHLLGTPDIDGALEALITGKTEGALLFIEEFIKSLKDLGIIEKRDKYYLAPNVENITIPFTIQDVIMARVDALPEGAKKVLQTGSVIEREFSYQLIKYVMALPEQELLSHLSNLRDSELIYERGIFPQSTYIFKHALTQDVVYNSILIKRRKQSHELVGNAIEDLYKDNINEHYEVLAEHYIASENYEKAAAYSRLAGNRAELSASFPDAIAYAKKRIACLEKLPKTEETQKRIIDARTKLGYYYIRMDYFEEAKKPVDPIVDLARSCDYKSKLTEIITIIGIYKWAVEEDFSNAITYLKEALNISKQIDDISLLRFPNYWLGVAFSFMCEFEKSLYHFKKALDVAVTKNTLWDISVVKSCLSYFVYTQQGNINIAYQYCDDALRLAEETGDVFPKTFVYTNYGIACYYKGLLDEAITNLLKGVVFCEKIDLYTWNAFTHFNLGEIYFDFRDYEKSKKHYAKSISIMKQNKTMPSWVNLNRICLTKVQVMNHEKDIDLGSLYKNETGNKVELYRGLMQRGIGEILLNIDDQHSAEAEVWIKKAVNTHTCNGQMWHLGKDYALYAGLLGRKGDQSKAKETLIKAIEIFKECGADRWAEKYEKELSTHP